MTMLHDFVQPKIKPKKQTSSVRKKSVPVINVDCESDVENEFLISEFALKSKTDKMNLISLLKEHIIVEGVHV
jgi:hypothetical protein